MKFYNNPKLVTWTPLITSAILEWANLSQIWRMYCEGSSASQSLLGWVLVDIAMILWWNYYRVCTPDQRAALISIKLAILVNIIATAVVVYYR